VTRGTRRDPPGVEIVDSRSTRMPGLIDAHTHMTSNGSDSGEPIVEKQLTKPSPGCGTVLARKGAIAHAGRGCHDLRDLGADQYRDIAHAGFDQPRRD